MRIGITELIVVFVIALFVVGPDKLPAYAKKLGEALAQFRKYSEEATKDIKESIVEPLEEAQRPLKEAVEPLHELEKEVRGNVKEMQDSFAGIGKAKPSGKKTGQQEPEEESQKEESREEEPQKEESQEGESREEMLEIPAASDTAEQSVTSGKGEDPELLDKEELA